jgi:hypothetical protein
VKWYDNTTAYTKTVNQIGKYPVELNNSFGCVEVDTFYVRTKQAALKALINNTRELYKCISSSVNLTVDYAFAEYTWSTGVQGNAITVSEPGKYSILVKDAEDCLLKDSILVNDFAAVTNNIVSDMGTYLEAITSTTYQWYKDGVLIPNADDKILTVQETGNYYVSILDINGCTSVSNMYQKIVVSGVHSASNTIDSKIYPNPGTGAYVLEFASQTGQAVNIIIYNALGIQVQQMTIDKPSSSMSQSINLENQPAGVYSAHISQGDYTGIIRIIQVE